MWISKYELEAEVRTALSIRGSAVDPMLIEAMADAVARAMEKNNQAIARYVDEAIASNMRSFVAALS